jgi:16S rRNA (guanine527-N7)-methyltransferase
MVAAHARAPAGATWDTGRVISDEVRAKLEAYLRELHHFNKRINLTAIAEDQAWHRHVDESRWLLEHVQPGAGARVVDIGSGGGAPGLPMALLREDLHVTLLDADARSCGFLLHVCGVLGLHRVAVVNQRAEVFGRDPQARESFDVAVSRAAAPPAVLCELALPLVRVGGLVGWLVGDAATAAAECAFAADACGGGAPQTAGADIVTVVKERPTAQTYPRRIGVPAHRPLLAP